MVIQEQGVPAALWDTYTVIGSLHRSKVYNEHQVFLTCLIPADEAEDTSVAVIGINPLETIPVIVLAVKGRILFVQMEQVLYIVLKLPVSHPLKANATDSPIPSPILFLDTELQSSVFKKCY